MNTMHFRKLERVLCIGAHADDIEIGCGGTLASLLVAQSQIRVDWIVFSGQPARAEEAARSAHGWLESCQDKHVQLESFRDGYFPADYASIKQVMQSLAGTTAPDLIFTHRLEDRHQDHRVLAELTWNAFRDHSILEYEIPKYEGDLGQNNLYVPLEPAMCELKISRLQEFFPSQNSKHWFDAELFRGHMRLRGIEAGQGERYAEAFYVRKCQLSF